MTPLTANAIIKALSVFFTIISMSIYSHTTTLIFNTLSLQNCTHRYVMPRVEQLSKGSLGEEMAVWYTIYTEARDANSDRCAGK